MARGKPKREKAAIPASYIRPRALPDGRTSYNVRAYDPATRTCKTLGTFKTRRAAERAFKKGAEALVANARPEPPPDVAPTASAELDEPRPLPSVSKKRARSPRPPRASGRERRSSPSAAAELTSQNKRRRKTKNAKNAKNETAGVRRGGARAAEKTPEDPRRPAPPGGRRVSAVFRTLASAAAAVSPFANLDVQDVQERREPNRRASGSPEGASASSRRGALARTFSTPAATPPLDAVAAAPVAMGGGDMWSRVCAFVRGGEYPVPVPGLLDDAPGDPGAFRDEGVPGDVPGDARDSPGPAERLAAFLESAVRRLRGGGGAAAGLEGRPAGVAVKTRGMTVTVDVRRE